MSSPLGALGDPWKLLELAVDGPLHPGGTAATERLLDRAGVDGGTRLLDVGCGAGEALGLASDRGAETVGLDRRPAATDAVRGDLTALPFRADSFDVVLGECVLCLSPDLGGTLAEVHRITRPGGRLALSTVTVEGEPPELPPPVDELLCLDGSRDRSGLAGEIERAGFDVRDVQSHRDDLLSMRDRLTDAVDVDRLAAALGDRGAGLPDGAAKLEAAVDSGRIGYVSVVATRGDDGR